MRLRSSSSHQERAGLQWPARDAVVTSVRPHPRVDGAAPPGHRQAMEHPSSEQTEAARSVQAAVLARHRQSAGATSVFVIGSLAAADESAEPAWKLACSTAALGYRTLLATLGAGDPAKPDAGAGTGMSGTGAAARAIERLPLRSAGIAGLSLMQLSALFPRLDEAIDRGSVARQLRAAASQIDLVIVDAGMLDAEALAGLAAGGDGAVLIVGRHRTRLCTVEKALISLRDRGVDMLGLVLI